MYIRDNEALCRFRKFNVCGAFCIWPPPAARAFFDKLTPVLQVPIKVFVTLRGRSQIIPLNRSDREGVLRL
jgi:hypothetical protein